MDIEKIRQHNKVIKEIENFAAEKLSAIGVSCSTCTYGIGSPFCYECDVTLCFHECKEG